VKKKKERSELEKLLHPEILIHVLPGGSIPERQTEGAIGYDAHARAIVSPFNMDPENPLLRETIFDFKNPPVDKKARKNTIPDEDTGGFAYVLKPGESVLIGVGFTTAMPFPLFYWVAPRSGLASKHGITVTNAPGTVDPDYRGEAGVLVYNRTQKPFILKRGMRIAQIVFTWAAIPNFNILDGYEKLTQTKRGGGGFGSTGI